MWGGVDVVYQCHFHCFVACLIRSPGWGYTQTSYTNPLLSDRISDLKSCTQLIKTYIKPRKKHVQTYIKRIKTYIKHIKTYIKPI